MNLPKNYKKGMTTIQTVKNLVDSQFPQFSHLEISQVDINGWDNDTFRLGKEYSIRLPSALDYSEKIAQEFSVLPILQKHLSYQIPEPLYMGKPSKEYPFPWGIYKWQEGKSLNLIDKDTINLNDLAYDIALFLNQLHSIPLFTTIESQWRGMHPNFYHNKTIHLIEQSSHIFDKNILLKKWHEYCSSTLPLKKSWVHGDMYHGNIILDSNNKLSAVIDFGSMCTGDYACDLVIAWVYFNNESQTIFKNTIKADDDTWNRAKAWCLWKSLHTIHSHQSHISKFEKENNINI